MSNGNGPQQQAEPGRPAAEPAKEAAARVVADSIGWGQPAEPATFAHIPDEDPTGSKVSDKSAAKCPNCGLQAIQTGNEIFCERCDTTFVITEKKGAKVRKIGPIDKLDQRVTRIEGTIGIMADDDDGPGLKEANARRAALAEDNERAAAELVANSITPETPAEQARPASQDGVHADDDEILGPRGDKK